MEWDRQENEQTRMRDTQRERERGKKERQLHRVEMNIV